VAEAWRNLTAAGARPLAVTDCLNFGNPERADVMGQFVGCIEGLGAACRALDFPVVSGNVSFYNETNGQEVQPTPGIGAVGLIADLDRMATPAFKTESETLIVIGETRGHLGASLYARDIAGRGAGAPPPVDFDAERRNGDFVRGLIETGRVSACHDVSDGGLLVAVAEMALAGGVGATLEVPDDVPSRHAWAFGEDQGRYVVSVAAAVAAEIFTLAAAAGVPAAAIGHTGGTALTVSGGHPISLEELREAHEAWMPAYMAAS
jgi:phosphoribosylformylglycinamidine synthase